MSGRRRIAGSLVIAAATLVAGCGADERPVPRGPPRPKWVSLEAARASDVRESLGHRELGLLELPQAGFPGPDSQRAGWTRVIVNVEASGSLYLRGRRWRSWGPSDPGLGELQHELRTILRQANFDRTSFDVRADRTTRWDRVRVLLLLGASEQRPPARLRFILRDRDGRAGGGDAALDVAMGFGPPLTADAIGVKLRGRRGDVTIEIDEWARPFGPRDALSDDPAGLEAANRTWDGVEMDLRRARKGEARVRVDDEVPWAYVAQTLSLLFEAGTTRLEVEGILPKWTLSAPPARREPLLLASVRDWPVPTTVALGFVLGIAVVGLPLLHRRPRRRRTTSASPPREA
jgi:hypothetical protein